MTRILIVDDHPIFRQGLATALASTPDLIVCGEGASAEEAVALTRSLKPDLVLLDLSMPGGGLPAATAIRAEHPDLKLAVLTASEDSDNVLAALRAGAQGYVLKGIGGQSLIDAVRAIASGEGYIAPVLAARMLSEMSRETAPRRGLPEGAPLNDLTPRELEVLELVAGGLSNKEIALRGAMQEKTVKHHMTRILGKLRVRNRTEAAMVLRQARATT